MNKMILAAGVAAAVLFSGMSVSAEQLWQYNDALTLNLSDANVKVDKDGHQVLTFTGVETIEGGTNTYTYVYDLTARTIQIKEMEQKTKKLHYTTSFNPAPSTPRTRLSANGPKWHSRSMKRSWRKRNNSFFLPFRLYTYDAKDDRR